MKKLLLILAISASIFPLNASAHNAAEHHHGGMRLFESPEVNISELGNGISGTFHGMHLQLLLGKKGNSYEGFLLDKDNKKISVKIAPSGKEKNAKLSGKFGDISYVFDSLDAKKGVYTFKKGTDTAEVSVFFEYRNGHHMVNPLFMIKNNDKTYMIRMKGECCYGRGLVYATMLYGLTNFDSAPVVKKQEAAKSGVKKHENRKDDDDHDHDEEHD